MAKTLKIFLLRFIAGGCVVIACFYCITQIAWPLVCKMQVQFNEKKANANKINLVSPHLKAVSLNGKTGDKECVLQKVAYYENTYKRVSRSHIKLLEYLEFHYGVAFSEKDIYQIFAKNVSTAHKNMPAFFTWLNFLKNSNFIQVQAGKICLTKLGVEFLQFVRQKNYFLSYSN